MILNTTISEQTPAETYCFFVSAKKMFITHNYTSDTGHFSTKTGLHLARIPL